MFMDPNGKSGLVLTHPLQNKRGRCFNFGAIYQQLWSFLRGIFFFLCCYYELCPFHLYSVRH